MATYGERLMAKWFRIEDAEPPLMEARCGRRGCCPRLLVGVAGSPSGTGLGFTFDAAKGYWHHSTRAKAQWLEHQRSGGSWREFSVWSRLYNDHPERRPRRPGASVTMVDIQLPAVVLCPLCESANQVDPPPKS